MTASAIMETIQFIALLAVGGWLLWLTGRRSAEKRADETERLRVLLDRFDPEVLNEYLRTDSGQNFLMRLVAQVNPPEVVEANAIRRGVVLGAAGVGCIAIFVCIMIISAGSAPPYVGGLPADLFFGAAGGLLMSTAAGILLSVRIINRRSAQNQRESI